MFGPKDIEGAIQHVENLMQEKHEKMLAAFAEAREHKNDLTLSAAALSAVVKKAQDRAEAATTKLEGK